jgi:hypothetical protein
MCCQPIYELYTMYDSHGVYLRVLWIICLYKFSRCHAVIFTVFCSIYRFSAKIVRFLTKFTRILTHRFFGKSLIYRWNRPINRQNWPNFPEFHQIFPNFPKTDGIARSDFPPSAEFSNTAYVSPVVFHAVPPHGCCSSCRIRRNGSSHQVTAALGVSSPFDLRSKHLFPLSSNIYRSLVQFYTKQ